MSFLTKTQGNMRYHVHDDLGEIRAFRTKSEAEKFKLPYMFITVDKRHRQENAYQKSLKTVGIAPF